MRLIQLDGIPGSAPVNEAAFQNHASLVGTDSALIHAAFFPNQSGNYYPITWEPDGGGPTKRLDSDANLVG